MKWFKWRRKTKEEAEEDRNAERLRLQEAVHESVEWCKEHPEEYIKQEIEDDIIASKAFGYGGGVRLHGEGVDYETRYPGGRRKIRRF